MSRIIIALMAVAILGHEVIAEDMPLSSFTIVNEPFKKVENPGKMPGPQANNDPVEETQLQS